jgi:hypothetical protein
MQDKLDSVKKKMVEIDVWEENIGALSW